MAAARELARHKPLDRIGLSEVARRAGVSWPTVKRYVGSRSELHRTLLKEHPELGASLPDTRHRLLEAAAGVFARAGYEGATLDEIAKAAGLTKGAVYWHFDAKAQVFAELLEEMGRRRQEAVHSDLERAWQEPSRALERLIALQLDRARQAPHWAALLLEFVRRRDRTGAAARVAEPFEALPSAASQLVRRLQAAGHLDRAIEPDLAGRLVGALVDGLLLVAVVAPTRADPGKLAPVAARVLERGLRGD